MKWEISTFAAEIYIKKTVTKTMRKINWITMLTILIWMGQATVAYAITVTDTIFDRKAHEHDFAFGADIGFVSQMESWGTKWLDKNGRQRDILQILKDQGINNVRLRVWVNPSGGWCGKEDVVKMAKRADKLGMGIMLSFHYSDSWADPGTQDVPAAWKNHTVAQLEQDVYNHTQDIINALKAEGITPRWAQIGNETKRGMFYPTAQTNKGGTDNFAKMLKAGIKACKDIDPEIQTIIHLPDGHDNSLYRNMFDQLKSRGVKWDIIGMSAYPRWSHLDGPTMITKVMANVKDLKKRYGTPVMVVETGHYWNKPIEANHYLVGLIDELIKDGDPGTFYWEPESMAGYDLGAWDQNTKKPTEAMDAFLGLKHTEVTWVMRASVAAPEDGQTLDDGDNVTLKATVEHVQGRSANVEFYLDKKLVGSAIGQPYELAIDHLDVGVHTLWGRAVDADKHTQMTDTILFYVGQSCELEQGGMVNPDEKGGSETWNVQFMESGKYLLAFDYEVEQITRVDLWVNGDSLGRLYFYNIANNITKKEIEIPTAGEYELKIMAAGIFGIPSIKILRIFPLDQQQVPIQRIVDGVGWNDMDDENVEVDVYNLAGQWLYRCGARQLGVTLGDRESAVVSLPNCVGGTPNIVRKHRLK